MGSCSGPSNFNGGIGLFGASMSNSGLWYSGYGALHVCTTTAPGPAQPAVVKPTTDPKRLIIYSTKDQLKNSILANWVGADKATYWQLPIGTYANMFAVYSEIVVMPFDQFHMKHLQLTNQQEKEVFRFMLEDLPNLLAPGGRIINLNDISEEQNEPQGLSGQADVGEPDAG